MASSISYRPGFISRNTLRPDPTFHSEVGRAFIRNYNPTLGVRNRCVVQDKQGLIYIASEHGVHEYDGVTWRIIEIPHALPLMSLASAPDNRIYIGATNDFGYLAP
ncbi:hypothetical protein IH785_15860 [candidate division KSB1 bacterium]|nr:hypothetical protein [candidate division KSB1 bacterium]